MRHSILPALPSTVNHIDRCPHPLWQRSVGRHAPWLLARTDCEVNCFTDAHSVGSARACGRLGVHGVRSKHDTETCRWRRYVRLVCTGTGPAYFNAATVAQSREMRRVRNIIYTHDFAETLWQELLMCHSKAIRHLNRDQLQRRTPPCPNLAPRYFRQAMPSVSGQS